MNKCMLVIMKIINEKYSKIKDLSKKRKIIMSLMLFALCNIIAISILFGTNLRYKIPSMDIKKDLTISISEENKSTDNIIKSDSNYSDGSNKTESEIIKSSDIKISRDPNIPEWYNPGKLTIMTLLKNSSGPNISSRTNNEKSSQLVLPAIKPKAAGLEYARNLPEIKMMNSIQKLTNIDNGNNNNIILPDNSIINTNASCDADFISLASSVEYPGGIGIYYDIKNKRTICFSYKSKDAVIKAGLLPTGGYIQIIHENPASGNCVIEIRTADHKLIDFYFYNIYDNRFFKFPININQVPYLAYSPAKNYYAAAIGHPDLANEIILIDVSDGAPKKVSISNNDKVKFTASMQVEFSNTGNYLIYGVCDDNGQLYDENLVTNLAIYNIKEKTTIRIKGNFVRFLNDDHDILLENQGVGQVFDCNTGEDMTGKIKMMNWQKFKVCLLSEGNSYKGFTQSARLVPLFAGLTESTPIKTVSAIYNVDEYIYFYMAGDNFITCYSIDNGKRFTASIDEKFLEEIKSIDQTQTRIIYHIDMSIDRTKLLLMYTTDKVDVSNYPDTEFSDERLGILFKEVSCLAELKSYVDSGKDLPIGTRYNPSDNPYKNMEKFYIVKGNGYSSLVMIADRGFAFVAVEDYRDGTFTLYSAFNMLPWDMYPEIYNGSFENTTIGIKPYRKQLNAIANQETTIQTFSYIKNLDPYYDYASFYTNGSLDKTKITIWLCRETLAFESEGAYISDCVIVDGASYGKDIYDRDTLAKLMRKILTINNYITPSFNYDTQFPNIGNPKIGNGCLAYNISLSMKSDFTGRYNSVFGFNIGTNKDGKYFIWTPGGYAFLDISTYNEFVELCRTMYK